MALGLVTACSDNDLAPKDNNGSGSDFSATGYLAVEIKLPQETSATRDGGPNDNYSDGTANEYRVDNAMIVLFKGKAGEGEKNAKFYRAQDLKKPFFDNSPEDDNITSSYMAAIEVLSEPKEDENIWALVVINRNGTSTKVNDPDENGNSSVTIGNHVFTSENTFADVLAQITEFSFLESKGEGDARTYSKFFMANAPLSVAKGGNDVNDAAALNSGSIRYLTNLGNKVYATPDEAKQNVSGCIYVERAVAKVTYKDGKLDPNAIKLKFHKMDADGNPVEYADDEIIVDADVTYALTNTNNTSYVVRNVEFGQTNAPHFRWDLSTLVNGHMDYRMVGSVPMPKLNTPFHLQDQNLYRTYFCLDPNFREPMGEGKTVLTDDDTFYSLSMPLYCKENTFNAQNQNYANTTMAVFRVDLNLKRKVNGGEEVVDHMFIRNDDYSKIYLTKEDAGYDEIVRIARDPNIQNAMAASLKQGYSTENFSVTGHLDITLGREYDAEGNPTTNLIVKEIKLKVPEGGDAWFDEASKAKFAAEIGDPETEGSVHNNLINTVNQLNEITEFSGGVSYYAVPIKHFGDYYTPWGLDDNGNEIKGTLTSEVYNDGFSWTNPQEGHAAKYLGRYGVVRNNWYELNISEILTLGAPTIEEIDMSLSDDNNADKKYFSVEIHTLSWAKRTQKVQF